MLANELRRAIPSRRGLPEDPQDSFCARGQMAGPRALFEAATAGGDLCVRANWGGTRNE